MGWKLPYARATRIRDHRVFIAHVVRHGDDAAVADVPIDDTVVGTIPADGLVNRGSYPRHARARISRVGEDYILEIQPRIWAA